MESLIQVLHLVIETAILCLLFLVCATPAKAEVQYDGAHTITISGEIRSEAHEKLSALLENAAVSTVIFRNSGGGSLAFGLKIGKLIAEKKIGTVAEGICASACAIAFMGGDSREFSSQQADSALMFHPGFAGTSQLPAPETKAILFTWLEARTGQPLAPGFVAAMAKITQRKGGVYFLAPSHAIAVKTGSAVFFCEGSEQHVSNCAQSGDTNAEKMHIISTINVH